MASRIGMARRLERAYARIDAAVETIAPDAERPHFGRNHGTAQLLRAEWLADTLEGIASGASARTPEQLLTAELEAMKVKDLKPRAEALGIDPKQKKAELVAAIAEAELAAQELESPPEASGSPETGDSVTEGGTTQGDDSDAAGTILAADDLAAELNAKTVSDLKPLAKRMGVDPNQKKDDLIAAIIAKVGE